MKMPDIIKYDNDAKNLMLFSVLLLLFCLCFGMMNFNASKQFTTTPALTTQ